MQLRIVFLVVLCASVVFSLGGIQKTTGDDEEVQNALGFAMNRLNAMSNNYYRYMAIKTHDATKQVVSGKKFCIVVDIGSSSKCTNSPANNYATLKECPAGEKEMECRFIVWQQMWLREPNKLQEHKCSTESHFTCPY